MNQHTSRNACRRLSPTQQVELIAWYRAKKALGTIKQKSRELGVSPQCIYNFFTVLKRREDLARRRRNKTRQAFYKQLANLPF